MGGNERVGEVGEGRGNRGNGGNRGNRGKEEKRKWGRVGEIEEMGEIGEIEEKTILGDRDRRNGAELNGGFPWGGFVTAQEIKFKNFRALMHSYIPAKLPHREREFADLMKEFSLVRRGFPPPQMAILGPSGSGKTATVRKVLAESDVRGLYVVSELTGYATIINIGEALLGRRLWGMSLAMVWNEIERNLPDGTILVLDEADKFMVSDRRGDLLLYYLSRKDGLGLILISNKSNLLENINDPRVKSSLRPVVKYFTPYNAQELEEILRFRAMEAIGEDYMKYFEGDGILKHIAACAKERGGDARYAIDLLRESLRVAVMSGSMVVRDVDVERAKLELESAESASSLTALSGPHRLLLLCALRAKRVGQAYRLFNEEAPKYLLQPLTERRLRDLLNELELMGFLFVEKQRREWLIKPCNWYDQDKMCILIESELRKGIHA